MESLVVDSVTTEKYFRIAAISVAFYDYLITLPAEWRFYRSQSSVFHISLACALFILIRYVSIVVIIFSNYGFFSTAFTLQTCRQYYLLAPTFKVVQTMISQVILGVRTFNIVRRERRIGIALLLLYLVSVSAEWFAVLFHGTPASVNGNCTSANTGKVLTTWFYYLAVMMYDIVMVTVSTIHLLRYNPLSSRVEQLIRVLIYDGIGYFIALSVSNVLNLILYHTTNVETQTAGSSMGYAVTWIMSQRILINIREPNTQHVENVIVARNTLSAQKKVMSGLRSQFESKSHSKGSRDPMDANFGPKSPYSGHADDIELDVRVRVERSMVADYTDESEQPSAWGPPRAK